MKCTNLSDFGNAGIDKAKPEINEKEMKETIAKINKTKSWFFK